jgi:DNA polymerase-3 subunit alpha
MTSPLFVHLRVHSAYSLAEGMFQITDLVKAVRELEQPAVAVTDNFNCYAALEFSDKAAAAGIQPIIGAQITIADDDGLSGEVVLLVQNEIGWLNLSKITSAALLEESDTPSISPSQLASFSDGLIVLTGGAGEGYVAGPVAEAQVDLARARLDRLLETFPGRVYIELQRHGTAREQAAEPHLLDMAYNLDVPIVATNNCYFAKPEMLAAHEILLCISDSVTIADESRRRETEHHYLKSAGEMALVFEDLPEAIENTVVIARRCAYRVPVKDPILPAFPIPEGMNEEDHLRDVAAKGLKARFETPAFADIRGNAEQEKIYGDRLAFELDVIIEMGFAGYFLIVSDFMIWAKNNGIPVGPGRGSGAGSLVAYVMEITDLDPIKWGLLFERFLNPERVSMPDFDIDFCQDRRDEVITYVQDKYGYDKVAQITTFGTLKPRAAIRDVGRVTGVPYGLVDRIAKLVPFSPDPIPLPKLLKSEEELKREYDNDPQVAELLNLSCQIEGLYRHASIHAAGLVIGDRELTELVPLCRDSRSEIPATQFSMKWVEKAGLVKFDFLGLKTLSVLKETIALLARRNIEISLEDIPLEDDMTFKMLSRGDTVGVFQLESSGMRDVLRGLKPDRFEDIIAVVALYRPGPMENIPSYISRKHGKEEVEYMHPWLEPVLSETYGIMIYQEQVQQAAQVLAGYTLGGADILRRAMGKKIQSEMDAQREKFISGAAENNISEKLATHIFNQINAFAGYGFNKSHAAGYALIAWQTAWLKANYPAEFSAASMTYDSGNTDKLSVFKQDCASHDIAVLPPCINASEAKFVVEEHDGKLAVRYALGAIRNVGIDAMRHLVEDRQANGQFKSIEDFITRMSGSLTRRFLENLIKAGAFDGLENNRTRLTTGLETIVRYGLAIKRDRESNQENLFADDQNSAMKIDLPDIPEQAGKIRLQDEFSALGLYISAHPMDGYNDLLADKNIVQAADIEAVVERNGQSSVRINLAGIVTGKQIRTSARGNRFAFAQFTDQSGSFEVTIFSEVLAQARELLDEDAPLMIRADAELEDGKVRLLAQSIRMLDEAISAQSRGLEIKLSSFDAVKGIKEGLSRDGGGAANLVLAMQVDDKMVRIPVPGGYKLSPGFRQMVRSLPGISSVRELN